LSSYRRYSPRYMATVLVIFPCQLRFLRRFG